MADFKLASIWHQRTVVTQNLHYRAAMYFQKRNLLLGAPVIVLTAVVGTSVFAALKQQPEFIIQVAIGVLSITATVLSSLQTFLAYGDRAEKHRLAGARYGAVGRKLESMLASEIAPGEMKEVRESLDSLALECPHLPDILFRKEKEKEKTEASETKDRNQQGEQPQ